MRPRVGQILGFMLVVLGVTLLVIGTLLPYYKTPQRLQGTGPKVEFTATRPYWITSYIVPPIDKGQPINLSVLSDRPGSTTVLLAPYDPQSQAITGPVLVNVVFAQDQKGMVVFTNASKTAPYMLVITSYNSSFTFHLTSVWSPFYEYRYATTFGIAAVPFGLVMLYYDGIMEKREKQIEEALKNLKSTGR